MFINRVKYYTIFATSCDLNSIVLTFCFYNYKLSLFVAGKIKLFVDLHCFSHAALDAIFHNHWWLVKCIKIIESSLYLVYYLIYMLLLSLSLLENAVITTGVGIDSKMVSLKAIASSSLSCIFWSKFNKLQQQHRFLSYLPHLYTFCHLYISSLLCIGINMVKTAAKLAILPICMQLQWQQQQQNTTPGTQNTLKAAIRVHSSLYLIHLCLCYSLIHLLFALEATLTTTTMLGDFAAFTAFTSIDMLMATSTTGNNTKYNLNNQTIK